MGVFWEHTSAEAAASKSEIKKAVVSAYRNCQTSLSLQGYGLYDDAKGKKLLSEVMEEVINETPSLFFVGRNYTKMVQSNTRQVIQLKLQYASGYMKNGAVNREKIKRDRKKLNKAANQAMTCVKRKMGKVEKAMLLHDYLVLNTSYSDKAGEGTRATAFGALVGHQANCQGYSLAYSLLLSKAGISSKCISSSSMRHMWNLVKVGSAWYHVDVTWDDPVNSRNNADQYGIVCHNNFLVSTAAIKKTGHHGIPAVKANSIKYDKKYWREIRTAFWHRSDGFLYGNPGGIYARKGLQAVAKCLQRGDVRCMVKRSANQYYCILDNQIVLFRADTGKLTKVYEPPVGYTLVQLKYEGKKLSFRYFKNNGLYTAETAA